jgi:glucose-1-phosphate thymidylyltransferase
MQSIILSGGLGSRLGPVSSVVSKQLLPVYDKPLIYYPLTTAILSGSKKIVLVTNTDSIDVYKKLLGNGNRWGLTVEYAPQEFPNGIPEAFIVAQPYMDESKGVTLFLGDNLLYGSGAGQQLFEGWDENRARIFGSKVSNPEEFGVAELSYNNEVKQIVEKPSQFVSDVAIPGIYGLPSSVYGRVKMLKRSQRGELEITDLLRMYMEDSKLEINLLPRGTAWLDTGTPEGLLLASQFVYTIQKRQGVLVGSPDEAAWRMGLISESDLMSTAKFYTKSDYGRMLQDLLKLKGMEK